MSEHRQKSIAAFPLPINARLIDTDRFVWVIAIEVGDVDGDDVWFHIVDAIENLHDSVPRDAIRLYPGEASLTTSPQA